MSRRNVALALAAVSAAVLAVMRPDLIFLVNTPTGGDMGAHVLGPALLREQLLETGKVLGWSNAWFAGFPLFYFYFPLPSLVIVFLDIFLPYGVAFKIVTAAGIVATPSAAYSFVKSLGYRTETALIGGTTGGMLVFAESFTIYGGNIASTLAGEFSFAWSVALGLFYLSALERSRANPRLVPLASLLLGLAALSHVIPTFVMVVASFAMLIRRSGGFRNTVITWLWGFAISGFWAVPLVARIGLTADMGWSPLSKWDEVLPTELWFLVPFALVGLVLSLRRRVFVLPVVLMGAVPVVYFWLSYALDEIFPDVIGSGPWKLWNGRLLPFWYLALLILAGLGVGQLWERFSNRLPVRSSLLLPASLVGVLVLLGGVIGWTLGRANWQAAMAVGAGLVIFGVLSTFSDRLRFDTKQTGALALSALIVIAIAASISFVSGWARWNYTGYEGKDSFPEYSAFMDEVDKLPDGRLHWEANADLGQYGTTMALMLIPYWSEGHTSMEGLYFESSLSTPFSFVNASEMSFKPSNPIPGLPYHTFDFERGVEHLAFFGVDYYVAFTEEANDEAFAVGLEQAAVSEPFGIYEIPDAEMISIGSFEPLVLEEPEQEFLAHFVPLPEREDDQFTSFSAFSLAWYDDLDNLGTYVVDAGDPSWRRIDSLSDLQYAVPNGITGEVSDIEITDRRISFRTTAIGAPHLIKISYFPNWEATGADGPYLAAPSLLLVVPTSEDVVLEFKNTWVETTGNAASAVGIVALLVGWWTIRRRKAAAA